MQRHRGNDGERDGRQGRERDGEMSRIRSEKRVEGEAENERRGGKGRRYFTVQTFQGCDAGITDTLFEIKARAPGQRVVHGEREREACVRVHPREREKKIGKDGGEREGDAHGPA